MAFNSNNQPPTYKKNRKGRPNRVTQEAQALAQELGINPFKILLYFAAGDWKALGYESGTVTMYTAKGEPYEVDLLEPGHRLQGAKEAVQYLLPKRRAVEFNVSDIDDHEFTKEVERRLSLVPKTVNE